MRHDYRAKTFDAKKHVLIFSTTLSKALVIIRTERDIQRSSCKVQIIFQVLMKREFSCQIFVTQLKIPLLMKIRSVGVGLFHVDGQTRRSK